MNPERRAIDRSVRSRADGFGSGSAVWFRWLVLVGFAVTVLLAGPRAWRHVCGWFGDDSPVLAAGRGEQAGPSAGVDSSRAAFGGVGGQTAPVRDDALLDVRRVGVVDRPGWLVGPFAAEFLKDVHRRVEEVGIVDRRDRAAVEAFCAQLEGSCWVRSADVVRASSWGDDAGRFRVQFELRRPCLALAVLDEADPESETDENGARTDREGPATSTVFAFVDRDGVVLPRPETLAPNEIDLPRVLLPRGFERLPGAAVPFGERFPDARVLSAAEVAVEWREAFVRPVRRALRERADRVLPRLVEIDASNLGLELLPEPWSEILVGLEREDGGIAWFSYGRAPHDPRERVPVETKRLVLSRVLRAYPGLRGVRRGDLRMENTWRDWIGVD